MKLESTNVTIVANAAMNLMTIKTRYLKNETLYMREKDAAELRDLLNDYLSYPQSSIDNIG